MKFDDNRPIYLQICDWVCGKILRKEWPEGERIPSVRELGALLQVNPNTVMRACERLQVQQIIYNQRGIGYFVAGDAVRSTLRAQRDGFLADELPRLFDRMLLLSVGIDEVAALFNEYRLKLKDHENE